MQTDESFSNELVSIIIPCYNHGEYLHTAIESVLSQSRIATEIIVVDDGSVDNTKTVANHYQDVKYIFQENKGLSAARNTGIAHSTGKYLVFLDADDWLLKDALRVNIDILHQHPDAAFVSGAHLMITDGTEIAEEKKVVVAEDHYQYFLKRNYVAMHATVMFRRWVFDLFRYDETLRAFEDLDIFLKITRRFTCIHHQSLIAAYRIHKNNMSGNIPLMLNSALTVLKRQKTLLRNATEKACYNYGIAYWKKYYSSGIYRNLTVQSWKAIKERKQELNMLFTYNISLYLKLCLKKILHVV